MVTDEWVRGDYGQHHRKHKTPHTMMYSLSHRFSSWSSALTTALFTVAILASVLTLLTHNNDTLRSTRLKNVKAQVMMKNTRNYGATKAKPKENAKFKFDLVADFQDVVDWNTKQIFTYVYVDLDDDTSTASDSKLVIWDKILTNKNNVYINNKNIKSKYSIWDYSPQLSGRTGHFKLGYNIQPWIGPLIFGEVDLNNTITFPEVKV